MKYKLHFIYKVLALVFAITANILYAQSPGGVSSGTARGFKIGYYKGTFNSVNQFGEGTPKPVPDILGYTSKITGAEFESINSTYYGLEQTGILEITTAGEYTFKITADDFATLYVGGEAKVSATYTNPGSVTVNFPVPGNYPVKLKFYQLGGSYYNTLTFTAVPAGSGITVPTDVDGRFVYSENAKLSAWYKATDLKVTANYGGKGIDKVDNWINKAPGYSDSKYDVSRSYAVPGSAQRYNNDNLINFNAAVRFDGDDDFSSGHNHLSYRGATKTMFNITRYTNTSGVNQNAWLFAQHSSSQGNGKASILFKSSNTVQMSARGSGASLPAVWTVNEPKLLTGSLGQETGGTALPDLSTSYISANGSASASASLFSNPTATSAGGLTFGGLTYSGTYINTALIPEGIYYPFKLTDTQEKRVNTYLGIKYGISLGHDYLNTSGAPVYSFITNSGYTSRIFGISRDDAEALYQKQSQSQMISANGYDFLVMSKGSIAVNNISNTGALADKDYLIVGDNNADGGALTNQLFSPSAASGLSGTCILNRLNRQWKAQLTGNPGPVTLRAGSSTAGSYLFSGNSSNLMLIIDRNEDGDNDFNTGTLVKFPVTNLSIDGIATFEGVTLKDGDVFTFGWVVTSPGGVSQGLKLWLKGDKLPAAVGAGALWASDGSVNFATVAGSGQMSVLPNELNYNSALYHYDGTNDYLSFASHAVKSTFWVGVNEDFASMNHMFYNAPSTATFHGGSGTYQNGSFGSASLQKSGVWFNNGNPVNYTNPWDNKLNLVTTNFLSVDSGAIINSTGGQSGNSDRDMRARIGEIITYDNTLSVPDQQRVESYLAIKYSIPWKNGSSDYIASDGTTKPWVVNATYKSGIFGIGRDDCSGLNQRQSKGYASDIDNVAIGLKKLEIGNTANTGSFAQNKQFIMIANDGGAFTGTSVGVPATYSTNSCNANRYARSWRVKNTGSVTNSLQMSIGNNANKIPSNWNDVRLAINASGDNTFASATILVKPTSIIGGVATFDNVQLPDGAVFTLVYTLGFPGGVSKPTSGTDINGVKYTNGVSFTLYAGTASVSGNQSLTNDAVFSTITSGATKSTGYYTGIPVILNNAATFFSSKTGSTNFAIEFRAKLYVPVAGNVTFGTSAYTDDRMAILVNNGSGYQTGLDIQVSNSTSGGINGSTINFPAIGYYDIIVRMHQGGGDYEFRPAWNIGSGKVAIPDANLFVQPKGPSAWFISDDNSLATFADGTSMQNAVWPDLSGNGNSAVGRSSGLNYYGNTPANLTNFNPSIYFNNDYFGTAQDTYLNGFAYGQSGKSVFAVAANNNLNGETIYTGQGRNSTGTMFGLTKLGGSEGKLQLFSGNSNSYTEPAGFYTSSSLTTDIVSGQYASSTAYIYANGMLRGSGNLASTTPFNIQMGSYELQLGSAYSYSANFGNNKPLNEVIYYPWSLSADERQRINSYLAIKWGTTLDQSTPTNYIASNGSTIWNAGTAAGFKYDITGIGRDNCGNINQKQSTSTDGSDIVAIGLGNVAVSNLANSNDFANDKTFLMWAHNNGSLTTLTPVTLTSSPATCYVKTSRVWQAQTVNTVGTVGVVLGKQGFFNFTAATYKPVLLVSNSADMSGATEFPAIRIAQGKAYFENITFSGTKYFTIAFIAASPGGVKTNLTTWFNAGYDVYTDVAQSTPAVNDGDAVASMNNLAINTNFTKVEQSTTARMPVLKSSKFNYNPSVFFDNPTSGTGKYLISPTVINTTDYRSLTQMTSVLAGSNYGTNSYQTLFWGHTNGSRITSMERAYSFWNEDSPKYVKRISTLTDPEIYTFSNTSTTVNGWRLYSNLKDVSDTPKLDNARYGSSISGSFVIGGNATGGYGANYDLGEFVIYSDDKGAATTSDMRRIHSYLATKYGYTLDAVAMDNKYLASDGTTVTYNDVDYWNRITGIGRDDCTTLEQKQSFSQDATGALVKISIDPNGLATSNLTNPVSFATDKSYLLFGDNNKSLTWNGNENIRHNNSSLIRLSRVWKVKETGTVGSVYIQVPGNSSTLTYKLPATLNASDDPVFLLVSNTADFNNPVAVIEMVPTDTDFSAVYDYADGQYYTFATLASCLAPAGIADGFVSWFRTDNKDLGALLPNAQLVDEKGINSLTRNAAGVYTVNKGSANSFNFNRTLALTGGAYLEKILADAADLTSQREASMYAVGLKSDYLFGISKSANNAVSLYNPAIFANGPIPSGYAGTEITGTANTYNLVKDLSVSSASGYFNASVNGGTSANMLVNTGVISGTGFGLRIGAGYLNNGSTLNKADNTFAEAFSYSRALTANEKQVIDSYLAIKYGQTLPHHYYAPNYNGANAVDATLYNVSSYGNRIFGIGHHVAGCFTQNQSTSALAGSMLKISIDNAILEENSHDASKWVDGNDNPLDQAYTVIGDDNGSVSAWNVTGAAKPVKYVGNLQYACATWLTREWKVTTTKAVPDLFITIPDASSSAATRLPAVSTGNSVYMLINDTPDFETAGGNLQEVLMTFNTGTKEWEASHHFDAGTTKYITFASRPITCGRQFIITNPATSTQQLKKH